MRARDAGLGEDVLVFRRSQVVEYVVYITVGIAYRVEADHVEEGLGGVGVNCEPLLPGKLRFTIGDPAKTLSKIWSLRNSGKPARLFGSGTALLNIVSWLFRYLCWETVVSIGVRNIHRENLW